MLKYLRYVIGCAASPAKVTYPWRQSQGLARHSGSLSHQIVAVGAISMHTDRHGSTSFLAWESQFFLISSGPKGAGLSLSGQVKLNSHCQGSGLTGFRISWTIQCTILAILLDLSEMVCLRAMKTLAPSG